MKIKANLRALTPEELGALALLEEKLGVDFVPEEPRKSAPLPEEHFLQIVVKCETCGSCKVEFLRMTRMLQYPYTLKGIPCTEMQVDFSNCQKTERRIPTCEKCEEYLLALPKEELVHLLLKALRKRSIFDLTG